MRFSKQRQVVYEVLCATTAHPDAATVFEEARKALPSISLATVYRNLDELCALGKVKRISVDGSAERFDAGMHAHAHFVCTECNRVLDAGVPTVQVDCDCGIANRAEVMLYGVCNNCKNKIETKNKEN